MFLSDELARDLIDRYGSPLYVYDEKTLRVRCAEMRELLTGFPFRVQYSAKANSNLELLKIIREEGIGVDAMSPGEIHIEKAAGYTSERIFYVCNNVSADEMRSVSEAGVLVGVDSLSQLELYGRLFPGASVAVRFNPGVGAGHHAKVVTGGKKTKFGVEPEKIPEVKEILGKYGLKLAGINQHIGSLFLTPEKYLDGMHRLLEIARGFPGLGFIDFGGGFGVPYREEEKRLDLSFLSAEMGKILGRFVREYDNKEVEFRTEPGRYIVAECGVLLGSVYAVKESYGTLFAGTDLGMNVLMRPVLYDAYHRIDVIQKEKSSGQPRPVTVVGNICESGDIIAKERLLPPVQEGDLLAVRNAGAYGYSMASSYNCRRRPAEVLLRGDGSVKLIRRRESFEDLMRDFEI